MITLAPWQRERVNVRAILAGQAPENALVTVKGWVRTRRDFEGGHFVRARVGRIVVPSGAGGRPQHACQLQRRGHEAHGRLRGGGDGNDRAIAGEGAAVRDAGERDQGGRLGRRPGHVSDSAEGRTRSSSCARWRTLRPRTNIIAATTRVRHTLALAIHRFFHEHGFFWVNTPIITATDAEGAGEMFRVSHAGPRQPAAHAGRARSDFAQDFFGREAFLTVSRAAQRRDVLPGADQGLHVRADLPRRELATRAATSPSSG